jgi:3-oxoacyl-[acyl-carrier-protein] synthase-1
MMQRFSLTALGMVNALGSNLHDISVGLFQADTTRFSPHILRTTGAMVPIGKVLEPLSKLPTALQTFQCRNHVLAYIAFQQITDEIKVVRDKFGAERVGVVIGSSTSGLDASEAAFFHWQATGTLPEDYHYETQHEMGSIAKFIARLGRLEGPTYTLSTACSASAKVFASARNLLAVGFCDAVITGGVDALCDLTLNGFESLSSLARTISQPMSKNRTGLNLGEGAALFILTRDEGPIQLCGIGESCDAYHMSSPHPEGYGAEAAMRHALHQACLQPADIHYLNLHGTGTQLNDAMEAKAVQRLFGHVVCSSTKPLVGHCLGAAGAMEIGFCWLALQHGRNSVYRLPPHVWDGEPDDNLPALHLVDYGATLTVREPVYFMSNSFAFGGNNCTVIIGRLS